MVIYLAADIWFVYFIIFYFIVQCDVLLKASAVEL